MKVLLVHNHYQQPGGEDGVFDAEGRLLEARGDQVVRYTAHNDDVAALGPVALARATVWNRDAYRAVRELLRRERPEVMHVHNTLPLISPSVFYAAHEEGVAVVQTLHNYRLLCPAANFYRDGAVCESCLGRAVPYPGVLHRCYRGSSAASGVVAATMSVHRALGTWTEQVDLFIALTEFARRKFLQGGLPDAMVVVKPNFVDPDPGPGAGDGGYALFVGRLSPEKGVGTLLAAWERLGALLPLRIAGDGPLAPAVAAAAARSPAIEWLGRRTPHEVAQLIDGAALLVVPSECYETFGRVVVEAYAAGTPVVAADIGAIAELIDDGRTGRLFAVGDPGALADQVVRLLADHDAMAEMRRQARAEFEAKYTVDRNYDMLMQAYRRATTHAQRRLQ